MKNIYKLIFAFSVLLFFSACSKVVVNYGNPSSNSGTIVIKTNHPVLTNLTLNDSLLVNGKHVKSITIKNVPEGMHAIHFSANSLNYKEAIDNKLQVKVESAKTNTQLITIPPQSNGYWMSQAIMIVGLFSLPFWVQ